MSSSLSVLYPSGKPVPPLFMAPGERQAAAAEWSQLTASGSAPTWMGQKVLDWAGSHRDDPRVPEALHLVVTSTRVGCTRRTNSRSRFQTGVHAAAQSVSQRPDGPPRRLIGSSEVSVFSTPRPLTLRWLAVFFMVVGGALLLPPVGNNITAKGQPHPR